MVEYPPDIAEARSRLFDAVRRGIAMSLLAGALAGGLFFLCLWLVRRPAVLPQFGPGTMCAVTATYSDTPLAAALGMGIFVFAFAVRRMIRPAWNVFELAGGRRWMSRSNVMGFDELCRQRPLGRYNGMLTICAVLAMLGAWSTLHSRIEFTPAGVAHFKPLNTARYSYSEISTIWWIPEGFRSSQLNVSGPGFVMETMSGDRMCVRSDNFPGIDPKPFAEHLAGLCGQALARPGDLRPR